MVDEVHGDEGDAISDTSLRQPRNDSYSGIYGAFKKEQRKRWESTLSQLLEGIEVTVQSNMEYAEACSMFGWMKKRYNDCILPLSWRVIVREDAYRESLQCASICCFRVREIYVTKKGYSDISAPVVQKQVNDYVTSTVSLLRVGVVNGGQSVLLNGGK
jgi:hypothetical protein